jgi:hypothetical protein
LYRDTAPDGFDHTPAPGQISGRPQVCTVITPALNKNCTMTAKIAPFFASYGLIKIVTKT